MFFSFSYPGERMEKEPLYGGLDVWKKEKGHTIWSWFTHSDMIDVCE